MPLSPSDDLMKAFSSLSKTDWETRVRKDLKGKPLESLHWQADEHLVLPPFFQAGDLEAWQDWLAQGPGEAPFLRGNQLQTQAGWQLIQQIDLSQQDLPTLKEALEAEVGGVEIIPGPSPKASLEATLKALPLDRVGLHIRTEEPPLLIMTDLALALAGQGVPANQLTGVFWFDPISRRASQRQAYKAADIMACEGGIQQAQDMPHFRSLGLDLGWIGQKGGGPILQLAAALSLVVDYLEAFERIGSEVAPEAVLERIAFRFPTGQAFFPEMAKYRAFRVLYAHLLEVMGYQEAALQSPFIMAEDNPWGMSGYDQHNNLLRQTTAAISAICGGVHALRLSAFDEGSALKSEHGARWARNIQHLLKHEAYFDKVQDPAGGAYYVEQMTLQMAEATWKVFQEIEQAGGFSDFCETGAMEQKLAQARADQWRALSRYKKKQVGINFSPNAEEWQEADKLAQAATLSLALPFTRLRQQADQYAHDTGNRLTAFLWGLGEVRMRAARLQFSRDLMASAGFQLAENSLSDNPTASIQEAHQSQAQVIVLCGDNDSYFSTGQDLIRMIRTEIPDAYIFLAGQPENWGELGVDSSLAAGMDRIAFLQEWMEKLTESA
ncbi:MAG: methylmalonyl-CoA mutase family protein [Bacteroidota bacterium]